MPAVSRADIQALLASIHEPHLDMDLLAADTLRRLEVSAGRVTLELDLGFPCGSYGQQLAESLRDQIQQLAGVQRADVTVGFSVAAQAVQPTVKRLQSVRNIIAVASAKGGVGKSTIAANLALALAAEGASVGMLDADIYGPSQAHMLGAQQQLPKQQAEMLEPVLAHGLQTMSIAYIVDQATPVVWRGPMVTRALQQFLFETHWQDLDYLVLDLPPGTGDIQLTLAQKIPVAGAVVVTTPQDLSLLDARKGVKMFEKVNIPVLGIVENMSTHVCSSCGHEEAIFGAGGGQQLAAESGVDLLGQLPLDIRIREQADSGQPTVAADPDGELAQRYREIARRTAARLSLRRKDKSQGFPNVVIEDT